MQLNDKFSRSVCPQTVVAGFSVRQAQDPEPVEGHTGDMGIYEHADASVWKPTPTLLHRYG